MPCGCEEEEGKGRVMWKTLGQGPEAQSLGVRSLDKKIQRSLGAQKRIKWIYWVQRKAKQKQGKKYTVLDSSAHCCSREKKYELQ